MLVGQAVNAFGRCGGYSHHANGLQCGSWNHPSSRLQPLRVPTHIHLHFYIPHSLSALPTKSRLPLHTLVAHPSFAHHPHHHHHALSPVYLRSAKKRSSLLRSLGATFGVMHEFSVRSRLSSLRAKSWWDPRHWHPSPEAKASGGAQLPRRRAATSENYRNPLNRGHSHLEVLSNCQKRVGSDQSPNRV